VLVEIGPLKVTLYTKHNCPTLEIVAHVAAANEPVSLDMQRGGAVVKQKPVISADPSYLATDIEAGPRSCGERN